MPSSVASDLESYHSVHCDALEQLAIEKNSLPWWPKGYPRLESLAFEPLKVQFYSGFYDGDESVQLRYVLDAGITADLLHSCYLEVRAPQLQPSTETTLPSYVWGLGYSLFERARFVVNGEVLEDLTSTYLEMHEELMSPAGQTFQEATWKFDAVTVPELSKLSQQHGGCVLYVPLRFFWTKGGIDNCVLPIKALLSGSEKKEEKDEQPTTRMDLIKDYFKTLTGSGREPAEIKIVVQLRRIEDVCYELPQNNTETNVGVPKPVGKDTALEWSDFVFNLWVGGIYLEPESDTERYFLKETYTAVVSTPEYLSKNDEGEPIGLNGTLAKPIPFRLPSKCLLWSVADQSRLTRTISSGTSNDPYANDVGVRSLFGTRSSHVQTIADRNFTSSAFDAVSYENIKAYITDWNAVRKPEEFSAITPGEFAILPIYTAQDTDPIDTTITIRMPTGELLGQYAIQLTADNTITRFEQITPDSTIPSISKPPTDYYPVPVNGYYPLYKTQEQAEAYAGSGGYSHTHTLNGNVYYMPGSSSGYTQKGVTLHHGSYVSYLLTASSSFVDRDRKNHACVALADVIGGEKLRGIINFLSSVPQSDGQFLSLGTTAGADGNFSVLELSSFGIVFVNDSVQRAVVYFSPTVLPTASYSELLDHLQAVQTSTPFTQITLLKTLSQLEESVHDNFETQSGYAILPFQTLESLFEALDTRDPLSNMFIRNAFFYIETRTGSFTFNGQNLNYEYPHYRIDSIKTPTRQGLSVKITLNVAGTSILVGERYMTDSLFTLINNAATAHYQMRVAEAKLNAAEIAQQIIGGDLTSLQTDYNTKNTTFETSVDLANTAMQNAITSNGTILEEVSYETGMDNMDNFDGLFAQITKTVSSNSFSPRLVNIPISAVDTNNDNITLHSDSTSDSGNTGGTWTINNNRTSTTLSNMSDGDATSVVTFQPSGESDGETDLQANISASQRYYSNYGGGFYSSVYNNLLPTDYSDGGSTISGGHPIQNLWDGTASTGIIRSHDNSSNEFEMWAYLGSSPVPVGRVLVWRLNHDASTWDEYPTSFTITGEDGNHNTLWGEIHTVGTITRSQTSSVADADAHFDIQISDVNKFNKVRYLKLELKNVRSGGSGYPYRTCIGQIDIRSVNNTSVGLDLTYTIPLENLVNVRNFQNVGIWNNPEQFVSTPTTALVGSYDGIDWANGSTNTIAFTVTLTVYALKYSQVKEIRTFNLPVVDYNGDIQVTSTQSLSNSTLYESLNFLTFTSAFARYSQYRIIISGFPDNYKNKSISLSGLMLFNKEDIFEDVYLAPDLSLTYNMFRNDVALTGENTSISRNATQLETAGLFVDNFLTGGLPTVADGLSFSYDSDENRIDITNDTNLGDLLLSPVTGFSPFLDNNQESSETLLGVIPMNVQLSTAGLETISNVFGLLSPIRYYITSSSSDLRFDVVPITQAQLAASTNPAEYVPPPTEDGLGNLLTTSNDVRQHRNDGLNACPFLHMNRWDYRACTAHGNEAEPLERIRLKLANEPRWHADLESQPLYFRAGVQAPLHFPRIPRKGIYAYSFAKEADKNDEGFSHFGKLHNKKLELSVNKASSTLARLHMFNEGLNVFECNPKEGTARLLQNTGND